MKIFMQSSPCEDPRVSHRCTRLCSKKPCNPAQYCATPVLLCPIWKDGLGMCYSWTLESGRGERTSHEGSKPTKQVFIICMCWASLLNTFSLCCWSGHFFFLMASQMHINIENDNKFWTLNSVPDIQRSRHLFIANYVPLGRKCNRTWSTVYRYVLQCM